MTNLPNVSTEGSRHDAPQIGTTAALQKCKLCFTPAFNLLCKTQKKSYNLADFMSSSAISLGKEAQTCRSSDCSNGCFTKVFITTAFNFVLQNSKKNLIICSCLTNSITKGSRPGPPQIVATVAFFFSLRSSFVSPVAVAVAVQRLIGIIARCSS